ncbi:ArsR/SmtB family transcription factor [Acetobacterium bakii]|uniref:Transcriptional regulator n=1 Tax=Acetobacterium bakii TaxID=52689 RepID=A0A0L6U5D9_9FIRM|nr:metalloregulator ArsR/SmtB family transcription factor [Acetobacterium bakii]KNZ43542.1 transcriptional regulator [Acetobacterium bakii]
MEQLVNIYKILSDETRLRMIILLAQKELCVCELCDILAVSQPTVSKNLSKFRDLNLVTTKRKEKFICYQLKTGNVVLERIVKDILDNLADYPQLISDKNWHVDSKRILDQCCMKHMIQN